MLRLTENHQLVSYQGAKLRRDTVKVLLPSQGLALSHEQPYLVLVRGKASQHLIRRGLDAVLAMLNDAFSKVFNIAPAYRGEDMIHFQTYILDVADHA